MRRAQLCFLCALGCGLGGPFSGDVSVAVGAEDELAEGQNPLRADGTWQRLRVRRSGRLNVNLSVPSAQRIKLTWTDFNGFRDGVRRPRCALDLRVFDGERPLTETVFNSSRNANGTAPDSIEFEVSRATTLRLQFIEVDDFSDAFEVKVDLMGEGETKPPTGLLVYQRGAATFVKTVASPTVVLAGGGRDVDEAMAAMLEAGKRGDVVVLRMDDTGGGYAEYFGDLGAHSVRELVFDPVGGNDQVSPERLLELRRVADAPWVRSVLEEAEVVFFAGGNQTKYFDVFYGTEVSRVLSDGAPRVIGGTSAGMHVMGKLVHTPRGPGNSVTSSQALTDPYIAEGEHSGTASLSFSDGLFSIAGLENIITDTHWSERSRLGRTLVFAARVIRDGLRPVGGFGLIACDESTAAVIGENGVARVFGTGSAFFFRPDVAPTQCEDNLPLEWPAGVPMVEIKGTAGGLGAFNVRSWTSVAPVRRVAVRGGIPFAL